MKRNRTILGTALLTTVVAALAAPAYAAEGGNGGEKSNPQAAQSTQAPADPNANGAEKANSNAAAHAASSANSPTTSAAAPGQIKKAEQAQSNAASSSAANAEGKSSNSKNVSSSAGVKPSNATLHNTSAAASSNETKLYGNGQTAGQVAIQHGASANAVLYGPGNSQPHKTAPCGEVVHGKGGGFDVHALKSHAKKHGCVDSPTATVPKDPAAAPSAQARLTSSPSASAPVVSPSKSRGVKGAATADEHADSGVLGSFGVVGEGTLPFTGFSLAAVALFALALVGTGLSLRRRAVAAA